MRNKKRWSTTIVTLVVMSIIAPVVPHVEARQGAEGHQTMALDSLNSARVGESLGTSAIVADTKTFEQTPDPRVVAKVREMNLVAAALIHEREGYENSFFQQIMLRSEELGLTPPSDPGEVVHWAQTLSHVFAKGAGFAGDLGAEMWIRPVDRVAPILESDGHGGINVRVVLVNPDGTMTTSENIPIASDLSQAHFRGTTGSETYQSYEYLHVPVP